MKRVVAIIFLLLVLGPGAVRATDFGRMGLVFSRMGGGSSRAALIISNSTVLDTAAVNSVIGLLSVLHGTGTYNYAITAGNSLGLFKIGVGTNQLQVAASLTGHDGSYPLTINATGGKPTPVIGTVTVVVTAPGCVMTGVFDLTNTCNSLYLLTAVIK
jgi:hypothetical protein